MKGSLHNMGSNWQQRDSKDEDLALFHDMRKRERRNFLYPLTDEIDASPTSTPTRPGRDLLPLDSEKNDYDWLLTPPSTPLFPSLDQDGPIVNLSQRRVLTRSASVSKTARLSYPQEPAPKVLHGGNPSPKRPSTASSTSSTLSSSRGRPLSPSLTSRSSPTVRSSSPCRTNTPLGRNIMAPNNSSSRSLTPTLRRNSTSPLPANRAGLTSGRSRGKSLSPKLGPWEPSIPGFSAEPPPNLRTSLTERTVQRGVSQASRNGVRIRGSSVEMFDASIQAGLHVDSPDGSGNWSLSYTNDRNSSQTSRASVVSSYEDDVDMAESVLSGSTNSDSGLKSATIVISKTENSSSRRCVLPAKRQMKSAGSTGDAMPFLSLAARRSYERQAAQRRNAQAMFRPLLSSAPITSFYTSRHGGMHLRSSGAFMDSSAMQANSRHEGLHVQATELAVSNAISEQRCEIMLPQKQETIEEESEGNSLSEEEALGCQNGSHLRDIEGVAALKGLEDNLADGCKQDNLESLSTPERNHETLARSKKDLHTIDVGIKQPQRQQPLNHTSQEEAKGYAMDFDPTGLSSPAEGCVEGRLHNQESNVSLPCADGHASLSSFAPSKDSEISSEESKAKENYVEDYKLAASGRTHTSYLGIGSACSQHGPQRVLSDLGSFRKHGPMKGSYTRSYDGLLTGEKNGNCDSMSDSHSFIRSLASAFDSGESVAAHVECSGRVVVGSGYSESTAVVDKFLSAERVPSNLERDTLNKGLPFCVIPTGTICDDSQCNDLEASTTGSLSTRCDTSSQAGLHSLANDLINTASSEASISEVFSGNLGNPVTCGSTSDSVARQDVLSILGSCASRITMLDDDAVQHECTEADCTGQSRRLSDALCTAPRLAGEISNGGDLMLRQLAAVSPLKRSVTLEEATDTILFCSSIVHELVYKAATLAIENEEQKVSRLLVSKRDFVALFGFSGADNRTEGYKKAKPTRNRNRQSLVNATVCQTSSFVQKQRMVHRQTPAVTMRQSPMERIGNAVMGNHEEMHMPKVSMLQKGKVKQGKRAKCRCGCCVM